MTAPCIFGVDPGLSGAIAFFFPVAPDRVAAEDMPVVAGEVDAATLAAHILQMGAEVSLLAAYGDSINLGGRAAR